MNTTHVGHWNRRGGTLVIDLAPDAAPLANSLEGEVPITKGDAARDLEPARGELLALLKEMKSFKSVSDPGNPDAQPFLDAFAGVRTRAKLVADRYAKAAAAFHAPAKMALADTSKLTAKFLGDMEALKEWAFLSAQSAPFDAAFAAARVQAKTLAARYAAQMGKP